MNNPFKRKDPSAADLDAVAEEQKAKEKTETRCAICHRMSEDCICPEAA